MVDNQMLDSRINLVEKEVAGIKSDVNYIRASIDTIIEHQKSASRDSRTNWGTLAAWATVILGVGIYLADLRQKPMDVQMASSANQLVRLWDRNDRTERWVDEFNTRISVLEAEQQVTTKHIDIHSSLLMRIEDKLDELSNKETALKVRTGETSNK